MSTAPTFALNRRLFNYAQIRKVWFGDLPTTATSASQDNLKKWFGMGSPDEKVAFDKACSSFRDALVSIGPDAHPLPPLKDNSYAAELAQAPTISAPFVKEIDDAVSSAHETALSLVLVLDQMSRNIFRTDQKLIYTHYDRISRSLLNHLLAATPRADLHPMYRNSPVYRLWFYMPLMHSEFLEDHRKYEELVGEVVRELEKAGDASAADYANASLNFGVKHREILERFGRYPYRNEVMGRPMTKEENEWLEAGGETFGTAQK
ncbi:hypothetical protein C8R43DRAFT_1036551 [Mycena crocata]|nr:hypothetical protein C8R43DRAFT_1036551 [Mycena crocata]